MGFKKGHPVYYKFPKGHKWRIKEGQHLSIETEFKKGEYPKNPFPKHHGVMRKDYTVSEETKNKISQTLRGRIPWNIGKKASNETKKKMSENRKGRKHWNWKGGKSFEPYSLDWTKTLKRAIRERDKYVCQWCKKTQGKQLFCVHHIDNNKKNCNPNNLVTLCRSCHIKLHNGAKNDPKGLNSNWLKNLRYFLARTI